MVTTYTLSSLLPVRQLFFGFALSLHRYRAAALLALLAGCGGGGEGSGPAQWPSQTIGGMVVNAGSAVANAPVYMYCNSGISAAYVFFFTTTDSSGAYSKSANNAVAPCVVYAQVNNSTTLYSYVKSFAGGNATAHVTPASDAMLSLTIGQDYRNNFLADTTNNLARLGTRLSAGADTVAWNTMRQKLLAGDEFTEPDKSKVSANVGAMVGDPVSATLQVTTGTASNGYFGLLQNLASNNLDSTWLWAYTSGEAQKITGSVVLSGAVGTHSTMHLTCLAGNHLNNYYVDTDSGGVYSALVNKTNTLCVMDVYDPVTEAYWFGYTRVSGSGDTATAHVTALTDTLFLLLANSYTTGNPIDLAVLLQLQTQLNQGKDATLWSTFRQNMITGPHFTAADDVNAMGDPITGPLQTTTANPPPAGYFGLLKKLGVQSRAELRAIATDP